MKKQFAESDSTVFPILGLLLNRLVRRKYWLFLVVKKHKKWFILISRGGAWIFFKTRQRW